MDRKEQARELRDEAYKLMREAKRLTADATKLLAAADILEPNVGSDKTPAIFLSHSSKGRAHELVEFLMERGPCKRRAILQDSGIPPGTLAGLLRRKSLFQMDDDHKWSVKPQAVPEEKEG